MLNMNTLAKENLHTAILIIIEGKFQLLQRFSGSKMALKAVESRFEALDYEICGILHMRERFGAYSCACTTHT
jgi:hypothetical protein